MTEEVHWHCRIQDVETGRTNEGVYWWSSHDFFLLHFSPPSSGRALLCSPAWFGILSPLALVSCMQDSHAFPSMPSSGGTFIGRKTVLTEAASPNRPHNQDQQ